MNDWCSCAPLREAQEKAAKWDAIVRCWECKFSFKAGNKCRYWFDVTEDFADVDPEGFCHRGERQDA